MKPSKYSNARPPTTLLLTIHWWRTPTVWWMPRICFMEIHDFCLFAQWHGSRMLPKCSRKCPRGTFLHGLWWWLAITEMGSLGRPEKLLNPLPHNWGSVCCNALMECPPRIWFHRMSQCGDAIPSFRNLYKI